jgi:flagellar motor switch protein FliN
VTETIEYEQFDQGGNAGPPTPGSGSEVDLSRLSEIPMELSVEIGRTHMTVGETLDLRIGSVVTLERLAGETADLLVNGSAIARGEVVVIDEQYGLRITEILDGQADGASSTDGEHTQPSSAVAGDPGGEASVPGPAAQAPTADADQSPAEESTPA